MSKINDREQNEKIRLKTCENIIISKKQRESVKEWLGHIKSGELYKRETNHSYKFQKIILQNLLGYKENEINENPTIKIDFDIKINNEPKICIEAKKMSQGILQKQHRVNELQETPVHQLWQNMRNERYPFGIVSNFNEFMLVMIDTRDDENYLMKFTDLENNDNKLKLFLGMFSRKYLIENITPIPKLIIENIKSKRVEISKEFYNVYDKTRLIIIEHLKNTTDYSLDDIIYYTQMYLNRIIFIIFVEDQGLVKPYYDKKVFGPILTADVEIDKQTISNNIHKLFEMYKHGDKYKQFEAFNGGLFEDDISDKMIFDDCIKDEINIVEHDNLIQKLDIEKRNDIPDNINPIVKYLLVLNTYDFSAKSSINILGYIFEKSITAIDNLKRHIKSQRKEQGIYYTNKDLTRNCRERTILPFLSKSKNPDITIDKLIGEYDDIHELILKIKKIKIIDPACGSGAFLLSAIELLLDIYDKTNSIIGLKKYNKIYELKRIIRENIYGVDINRDSIEITKLSIFLRLAIEGSKLPILSDHIKVGNSLIDDKKYDDAAIIWNKDYKEIMKDGGFDVIIGNPPWEKVMTDIGNYFGVIYKDIYDKSFNMLDDTVKKNFINEQLQNKYIKNAYDKHTNQINKNNEYYSNSGFYKFQSGDHNLYKLFFERTHSILNKNGYCGLILPSGIYTDDGSKKLRKLLFNNSKLLFLFGFINNKHIFEDIHQQTKFCILIYTKNNITNEFKAQFNLVNTNYLSNYIENYITMDIKMINKLFPDDIIIPELNNILEHNIINKLFNFPKLNSKAWDIKTRREFNVSDDSKYFHDINIGYEVYNGRIIEQFTSNFLNRKPKKWMKIKEGKNLLIKKETSKLKSNKNKEIKLIDKSLIKSKQLKLKKEIYNKYDKIKPKLDCDAYKLVWRSVAGSTNYRTLLVTILQPNVFTVNSLFYVKPYILKNNIFTTQYSYKELLFMCDMMNSFSLDCFIRRITSTNINPKFVKQLPIPRYDSKNILHQTIMINTLKLICVDKRFDKLKSEIGINETGVIDPDKRLGLITEININSAIIYDFTKNEFHHILKDFRKKDYKNSNNNIKQTDDNMEKKEESFNRNKKLIEKCKIEFDHYLQNK